jgi:hypothetical protein
MKSSATIFSITEVSWVRSAASQCDSKPFNFEATDPSSAGETSTLGDGFGVGVGDGIGVGFGGGVGVAVGTGVGFGVGLGVAVGFGFGVGVAVGTGVGFGVGFGVAVADGLGLGVRVGRGEERIGGGVDLDGNGPVGEKVSVFGREGEGAVTFGGVLGTTTRGVITGGGLTAVVSRTGGFEDGGVAIVIGVIAGVSAGKSDKFSKGLGAGLVISNGSGEAVSSGLTEALGLALGLGLGLAIALAVGFGLAEGEGDCDGVSTGAAGLLWRKGVDAASCARTRAAVAKNRVARTNERMMVIRFSWRIWCADASPHASAGSS